MKDVKLREFVGYNEYVINTIGKKVENLIERSDLQFKMLNVIADKLGYKFKFQDDYPEADLVQKEYDDFKKI